MAKFRVLAVIDEKDLGRILVFLDENGIVATNVDLIKSEKPKPAQPSPRHSRKGKGPATRAAGILRTKELVREQAEVGQPILLGPIATKLEQEGVVNTSSTFYNYLHQLVKDGMLVKEDRGVYRRMAEETEIG